MTQKNVERAVARATGESLATIRRLGFGVCFGTGVFPAQRSSMRCGIFPRRPAPRR